MDFFEIRSNRDIIYGNRPLIDTSTEQVLALNKKGVDILDEADRRANTCNTSPIDLVLTESLRATGENIILDTVHEMALRN